MSRSRWHITRDDGQLTLSRQLPVRFDVAAETTLPPARAGRVAHQVRQDLWRALQRVRGFSPVVEVTTTSCGLRLRAGGRLPQPAAPDLKDKISAVLEDPSKRERWLRHARLSEQGVKCGQDPSLLHNCTAVIDSGGESAA